MQLIINGETQQVAENLTAAQLVEQLGLTGQRVAMEVNLEIVPRSRYPELRFQDGDRIEIVHAVGGG